jgi:hypothetical protein
MAARPPIPTAFQYPPAAGPSQPLSMRPYPSDPLAVTAQAPQPTHPAWQQQRGHQQPKLLPGRQSHNPPFYGGFGFSSQNAARANAQADAAAVPRFPVAGKPRHGGGPPVAPPQHLQPHHGGASAPLEGPLPPPPPPPPVAQHAPAAPAQFPTTQFFAPPAPHHPFARHPLQHGPAGPNPPLHGPPGPPRPGRGFFPVPGPGPVSAPVVLGPLPGRPAVLVWHPPAPGRGGVWAAMPRERERRRRIVPSPVGGGREGMRGRGSPLPLPRGRGRG